MSACPRGEFPFLPSTCHLMEIADEYIYCVLPGDEDVDKILSAFERATLATFVRWSDDSRRKEHSERRLLWFDNIEAGISIPGFVDRNIVRQCDKGGRQRLLRKDQVIDHGHVKPTKSRFGIQTTKKVECSAKVYIKQVTLFKTFAVSMEKNKRHRANKMWELKTELNRDDHKDLGTKAVLLRLPLPPAHDKHLITVESGLTNRIT